MDEIQEAAIEFGNYVIQRIKDIILSFDELINSKESEHEKTISRVIKEMVMTVHTQKGAKLVDIFFNPAISLEEKARLRERFKKACEKIITNNLNEKISCKDENTDKNYCRIS
jgi:hypothetical protein